VSSAHLIFIPAVLILGIFIGFFLGGRAALDRFNQDKRREEARAEARRKREEQAKNP
jgi:hypothetical protein